MATTRRPRKGSLQFWPRKKAIRAYSRIRNQLAPQETRLGGFAGYKAGMTHFLVVDNRPNSMTKGEVVSMPVTIIECPPLRVASVRLYSSSSNGLKVSREIFASDVDKSLARRLVLKSSKKPAAEAQKVDLSGISDVRVNVYTQPRLTSIGKKKPEIFEVVVGGKDVAERFAYASQVLGKEIPLKDAIKEGQQVDIFGVTVGKGFQGPVKRFGLALRQHKAEKTKRGPGSLGGWSNPRMWTVAHAGQMGFHSRLERNKWILKLTENPAELNFSGGIMHYGVPRSHVIVVKGSVQGEPKRLLRIVPSRNPKSGLPAQAPTIEYASLSSKQGR
ncbi:50S ribosomal protein L3 [Candidatus Woesearchaeota archaeon]|nr:50S ribosomal protein L3 [Candidatus Woesearchaeota archaeon]